MEAHPHSAGTSTSSYQYHAPVETIPIAPVAPMAPMIQEEEPLMGTMVRQYSGPTSSGNNTSGEENGLQTSYLGANTQGRSGMQGQGAY